MSNASDTVDDEHSAPARAGEYDAEAASPLQAQPAALQPTSTATADTNRADVAVQATDTGSQPSLAQGSSATKKNVSVASLLCSMCQREAVMKGSSVCRACHRSAFLQLRSRPTPAQTAGQSLQAHAAPSQKAQKSGKRRQAKAPSADAAGAAANAPGGEKQRKQGLPAAVSKQPRNRASAKARTAKPAAIKQGSKRDRTSKPPAHADSQQRPAPADGPALPQCTRVCPLSAWLPALRQQKHEQAAAYAASCSAGVPKGRRDAGHALLRMQRAEWERLQKAARRLVLKPGRSCIEGMGLFATHPIALGALVAEYTGLVCAPTCAS